MLSEVGLAFLSAFLQVVFDRAARKEVIDFFLNRLDKALLEDLKKNLLALKAVLSDAEEKQFSDPDVREWVDRLKDAAYEADDILDAIVTKTSKNSQFRNPFAERVRTKVNSINEKLKPLVGSKDILGLKEGGVGKLFPFSSPTTSLVDVNEVYGRDGDRDAIKKFLLSRNANGRGVPVVAIVGMAGVGKTTLAQLLFNDDDVRNRFPRRSWAYVSGGLDVYETTKRIHGSVRAFVNHDIRDLNLLQLELHEWSLTRESFLLVLDDFWNENYSDWDILKRPFESENCEGRIIVTTRNQSVALTIRADLTHFLSHLSPDHSWKLFSSHAFKSGNPDKHPALKEIGKKIAERCKGLPLAAKTLGSLLRCKEDPAEWRSILNSELWELPNNRSDILPALILSYSYLPSHLKRCFAYCSIFPKGWKIEKWRLICLWMAEGILPERRTKRRLEDIGAECLQELLSRSFFQFDPHQSSLVLMHDLVHDLAQYVAGGFCSKMEDIKSSTSTTTVKLRHVSYQQTRQDGPEKFQALSVYQKSVRTFLPFRSGLSKFAILSVAANFVEQLRSFKRLRVLSLSNYVITNVPASIEKLKHLRFLDLSSTKIRRLPASVVELYNLQTLLLSDCTDLTELPNNMSKLINLRLLDIRRCSKLEKIPAKFGKLQALQVLKDFVVSVGRSGMSELGELSQLHSLSIVKLENVVDAEDASKACLGKMNCLQELDLEWTLSLDRNRETTVLEKLQPHSNLVRLKIRRFWGTKMPDWMGSSSLSSLVSLQLDGCQSCSSLPSIGQLPSIRKLHILNMESLQRVGPEFCGGQSVPFLSLEILKFENMPNWREWSPRDNNQEQPVQFPSLQAFHISDCPELNGDLDQFPEDKLHISRCPGLEELLG